MVESWAGTAGVRSCGATAFRAMWPWINSIGSVTVKGRLPVSTW